MSIKQKAVKGALWTAIQNWVGQAGSFVVFFVLARLLQPEDFGLVALANVFLTFLQIFLAQGFSQALVQRDSLDKEHLDTAFWTSVATGVLLAGMTFAVAGVVANEFNEPRLIPVLHWLAIVFPINALRSTQEAILERQFAFRAIAMRSVSGILTGGAVGIAMAIAGCGVWSLVGQQITSESVGLLVLWRASDWRPGLKFSYRKFQQLFEFGSSILAFNFLGFFNNKMVDLLIGRFLGTTALGYYAIAYRILQVLSSLIIRTGSNVSLPTFSRLKSDPERFRLAFFSITRLTAAIAFPVFAGVAVLAPELNPMLFGQKWLPAIPLLQILSILGMIRSVSFFKSPVLVAMGKPLWTVKLKALSVALNPVLFLIAYPWGIVAVTTATVIRSAIVFPVGQWAISRAANIPLKHHLQQLIVPLVSTLLMAVVLQGVKEKLYSLGIESEILVIASSAVIGAISYALSIGLLSPELTSSLLDIGKVALSKPMMTSNKAKDI